MALWGTVIIERPSCPLCDTLDVVRRGKEFHLGNVGSKLANVLHLGMREEPNALGWNWHARGRPDNTLTERGAQWHDATEQMRRLWSGHIPLRGQ